MSFSVLLPSAGNAAHAMPVIAVGRHPYRPGIEERPGMADECGVESGPCHVCRGRRAISPRLALRAGARLGWRDRQTPAEVLPAAGRAGVPHRAWDTATGHALLAGRAGAQVVRGGAARGYRGAGPGRQVRTQGQLARPRQPGRLGRPPQAAARHLRSEHPTAGGSCSTCSAMAAPLFWSSCCAWRGRRDGTAGTATNWRQSSLTARPASCTPAAAAECCKRLCRPH